MIIIIAEEGKKIHLGRVGENEARAVRFDISRIQAEFPGATFSVLNMRPQDPDAYPVNGQYIALDGSYLLWTIQSGDLAEDGLGECELKATLDGVIVKSIIWTTEICPALDGNGTPPEPWESWQQQVEEDADRAEGAAEDSEAWAVGERGGEPVEDDDPAYHNNAKYWAEQAEETLSGKADKVSGATNNHFAALDATGNLKDSGHADGDYARKTDTVLTTTLSRGRDATSQVGTGSLAFGDRVKATAPYSRANGSFTEASGMNAAAEGYGSKAAGQNAHAEGFHTRANNKDQHVFGAFNAPDPSAAPAGSQGRFIEIVGNGSDESNRSNARTLDWQGNERLKGDLYVGANADGTGGSKVAKVTDIPEPVDISGKADKVSGGTADNFAGLDAEGNLKDSGKTASDFVAAEEFRADAMPMSETDPTTVAQTATELKSQIDGKADLIRDTVSNVAIASVPDGAANLPLTALKFKVEPIQAGSGDPYPAGGGKNLLPTVIDAIKEINTNGTWSGNSYVLNGVTFTINTDAGGNVVGISTSGTASADASLYIIQQLLLSAGNYILNGCPSGGSTSTYRIFATNMGGIETGSGTNMTADGTTKTSIRCEIKSGYNSNGLTFKPMIRLSTVADPTFTPYSNIRPITGRTQAVVSQSGADTSNPTTHTVQFGSTVYSGTLDPVNGELKVDGVLKSFDGTEQLYINRSNASNCNAMYKIGDNNTVIASSGLSNMLKPITSGVGYTDFSQQVQNSNAYSRSQIAFRLDASFDRGTASATLDNYKAELARLYGLGTPLQVFYKLATPVTIQLDPITMNTLLNAGLMNVWADCGDIVEMTYPCDTKLYVEKRLSVSQTLMELIVTANREDSMKATKAYTTGNLLIVNGTLYRATTSIANGATLTPGTNVTATTVAAELAALA